MAEKVADLGAMKKSIQEMETALKQQNEKEVKFAEATQEQILQAKIASMQRFLNIKEAAESAAAKRIAAHNLTVDKDEQNKLLKEASKRIEAERIKALDAAKTKAAKGGKNLTKEEEAKINAEYAVRQKAEEKNLKKKFAREEKQADKIEKQEARKEATKANHEAAAEARSGMFGKGKTLSDRFEAFGNMWKNEATDSFDFAQGLNESIALLSDFASELKNNIDTIAKNKSSIDTRLQGSKNKTVYDSLTGANSYWDAMSQDIVGIAGVSPYITQEAVVTNLNNLVGEGIAFNVEQRAFLATLSDKIANTFKVTDASLVKLVRIQQADTTAARLGMESALTAFLNNMYETTEYMQSAATEIRANIYEASALMTATSATEFEYQVQKWMGSLYSVGFSSTSGLSKALGDLAAGKVSSISEGSYGNLLVMAANAAGESIADILSDGLDANETNRLMQAMVNYLGEIYNETKGSNLLAQQYASVFGLTASDLKAASNLATSVNNITNSNYTYSNMLGRLNTMADTMYQRTSYGEMLANTFDNLKYSTAAGIANNPAMYAIYTMATLLKDTTGGIDFSLPTVMGNGMAAQTFNVADILLAGSLGGGLLSSIGAMFSAGSGGGTSGSGILSALGIGSGVSTVTRGTGEGLITSHGASVSNSGYVGNGSGSDVQNKAMTDTSDSANDQTINAQDETEEKTITDVHSQVVLIYELLQNVTNGQLSFKVDMGNEAAWTLAIKEGNSRIL